MKRYEEKLTRRVLNAQMEDPSEGDFSEMVNICFEGVGLLFEQALRYLQNKQQSHSKVKNIVYVKLETQI